jgi:Leucine-rich repeat (LRR) protein
LRLSNFGLEGQFPQGLHNCASITGLELSANNFSGPIPSDIARQLPSLASLDLSYNSFSGEIPVGISNLTYLNTLNLQHNQLNGHVPAEFSALHRLAKFNVADNHLSGSIPLPLTKFPASNFAGNQGLCGAPLLTE